MTDILSGLLLLFVPVAQTSHIVQVIPSIWPHEIFNFMGALL